jgi:outer membrane immunogenic protein
LALSAFQPKVTLEIIARLVPAGEDVMRNQLLCGVAAIAIAVAIGGTSLAADLPLKAARAAPPPPIPMTWTGWYIGGHLGFGEAEFRTVADLSDLTRGDIKNSPGGIVGGMQAGYNWQFNSFVFGVEGDVSAVGWAKHTRFGTTGRSIHNSVNVLASLRGRLGFAFGPAMLYGTGGVAYTQAKYVGRSPGSTVAADTSIRKWGTVFGGGIEWRALQHLSLRGEALWYRFNTSRNFGTDHIWLNKYEDAWVARFGANYHF